MAYVSKDDKLIQANPGKTPHEYRLLGVSEKKVKELEKKEKDLVTKPQQSTYNQDVKQKVKPEIEKTTIHRATPFVKPAPAPKSDTVLLIERATGKQTTMSRHHAEKFARKNPKTHYVA